MPVYRLTRAIAFPPPEKAEEDGLLCVGGDLRPERLVLAYAEGIFPWFEEDGLVWWFSPDPRMVLESGRLHVGRSLRKTLKKGRFEVRLDTAFGEVMRGCAHAPRPGQRGTWISDAMKAAYRRLHRLGIAHSAEAWRGGRLVGGLYGVSIGDAFFGESMFAVEPDASKVAFVALVQQLLRWGVPLVDCQVYTDHLARFGAEPWPRRRYLDAIATLVTRPTRRGPWKLDADLAVLRG